MVFEPKIDIPLNKWEKDDNADLSNPIVKEIFDILLYMNQMIYSLKYSWFTYDELYLKNKNESRKLIEMHFFKHLKGLLMNELILNIAKLVLDPEFDKRHDNMGLKLLNTKIHKNWNLIIQTNQPKELILNKLSEFKEEAENKSNPIKHIRNKFIGHLDKISHLDLNSMPEETKEFINNREAQIPLILDLLQKYIDTLSQVVKTNLTLPYLFYDGNADYIMKSLNDYSAIERSLELPLNYFFDNSDCVSLRNKTIRDLLIKSPLYFRTEEEISNFPDGVRNIQ